jgi:hypothetical protein
MLASAKHTTFASLLTPTQALRDTMPLRHGGSPMTGANLNHTPLNVPASSGCSCNARPQWLPQFHTVQKGSFNQVYV